jgi:hypothetical protein
MYGDSRLGAITPLDVGSWAMDAAVVTRWPVWRAAKCAPGSPPSSERAAGYASVHTGQGKR